MIKKSVYKKYDHKCVVCGGIGSQHPVEAHEIWKFDDINHIQILTDIVAVCPACHTCIHFGLAQLSHQGDVAFKRLMKINEITKKAAEKYIADSFMKWADRSCYSWTLDVSHLKNYGIDVQKIKMREPQTL